MNKMVGVELICTALSIVAFYSRSEVFVRHESDALAMTTLIANSVLFLYVCYCWRLKRAQRITAQRITNDELLDPAQEEQSTIEQGQILLWVNIGASLTDVALCVNLLFHQCAEVGFWVALASALQVFAIFLWLRDLYTCRNRLVRHVQVGNYVPPAPTNTGTRHAGVEEVKQMLAVLKEELSADELRHLNAEINNMIDTQPSLEPSQQAPPLLARNVCCRVSSIGLRLFLYLDAGVQHLVRALRSIRIAFCGWCRNACLDGRRGSTPTNEQPCAERDGGGVVNPDAIDFACNDDVDGRRAEAYPTNEDDDPGS